MYWRYCLVVVNAAALLFDVCLTSERQVTTAIDNSNPNQLSNPTPDVSPSQSTEEIIIYVGVGVAALILLAFLRTFYKTLKRKGCPTWCPDVCRCYDGERGFQCCPACRQDQRVHGKDQRVNGTDQRVNGKDQRVHGKDWSVNDKDQRPEKKDERYSLVSRPVSGGSVSRPVSGGSAPSQTGATAGTLPSASGVLGASGDALAPAGDSNGEISKDKSRTTRAGNGHVIQGGSDPTSDRSHGSLSEDGDHHAINIHIPHDLVLRARKQRSLASLRSRASLSNLEDITESEEEEGALPTSARHTPSVLRLQEQEKLLRLVMARLAPLVVADNKDNPNKDITTVNEDGKEENTDDGVFTMNNSATATISFLAYTTSYNDRVESIPCPIDHIAPPSDHTAPQSDDTAPHSGHTTPHSDQPAPHSDHTTPHSDQPAPHSDHTAPHSDHTSGQNDEGNISLSSSSSSLSTGSQRPLWAMGGKSLTARDATHTPVLFRLGSTGSDKGDNSAAS